MGIFFESTAGGFFVRVNAEARWESGDWGYADGVLFFRRYYGFLELGWGVWTGDRLAYDKVWLTYAESFGAEDGSFGAGF